MNSSKKETWPKIQNRVYLYFCLSQIMHVQDFSGHEISDVSALQDKILDPPYWKCSIHQMIHDMLTKCLIENSERC